MTLDALKLPNISGYVHMPQEKHAELLSRIEAMGKLLDETYQWLHDGPMDSWDKRTSLHRRIGDALGKKRTEYHE